MPCIGARDPRSKASCVRVIIRGILFACRGHRDSDPPPTGKERVGCGISDCCIIVAIIKKTRFSMRR